jgi:protein SCO1
MGRTGSTICPITVRVFVDLPSRLGALARELRMTSIDPENETPAQRESSAKNFGAGLRWKFLTDRLEGIKSVQVAFDSDRGDKMTYEPLTLTRHARAGPRVCIDGFASPDELAGAYRKTLLR